MAMDLIWHFLLKGLNEIAEIFPRLEYLGAKDAKTQLKYIELVGKDCCLKEYELLYKDNDMEPSSLKTVLTNCSQLEFLKWYTGRLDYWEILCDCLIAGTFRCSSLKYLSLIIM